MTPVPRLRAYAGPVLLTYGFRPFFLFGAIYAGLPVLAWLPMLYGELQVASAFAAVDWHVHEMLYGYVPAAFQEELNRVMKDIDDPNSPAMAKRMISIEVVFAPDESRQEVAVGVRVKSKISGLRPKTGLIFLTRKGEDLMAVQNDPKQTELFPKPGSLVEGGRTDGR